MTSPSNFVVRIECEPEGFFGTGFLISSQYVLTCAHVASDTDSQNWQFPVRVRVRFADAMSAAPYAATVVACDSPDCAILRLDEPLSRPPVRLVANIRAEHQPAIAEKSALVTGFSRSAPDRIIESRINRVIGSSNAAGSAELLDLQIEGGLPKGMSGSPVLVPLADQWACFGMAYLGGEGSATSRLILADTLLRILERRGIEHPPPISADECLSRDGLDHLAIPHRKWTPGYPPGALLRAEYAVVPFFGRRRELEDLVSWATGVDPILIRLYVGEGGIGKTRLAIEACRHLSALGIRAGFLPRVGADQVIDAIAGEMDRPTARMVIVIDYVEIDQEMLVHLLKRVQQTCGRVRVMLLARGAGQWWERLKRRSGGVGDLLSGPATHLPLHMQPLAFSAEARGELFSRAAEAFARTLERSGPAHTADLSAAHFERVLFIHMAALMAIEGVNVVERDGILDRVLAREFAFWEDLLSSRGLDRTLQSGLVLAMAAVTLVKGVPTRNQAVEVLRGLPFFADERQPVLEAVAQVLHDSYGGRMWIDQLQPDLLGEYLVSQVFREYGADTFQRVLGL